MARGVKKGAVSFSSRFADGVRRLFITGRQHFTIMLIPHSEKKIFNFKISVFALVFYSAILTSVTVGFIAMATIFGTIQTENQEKQARADLAQARLDIYSQEINSLSEVTKLHETAVSNLLNIVGTSQGRQKQERDDTGDLTSFLNMQELKQGASREVGVLMQHKAYLQSSISPLEEVAKLLETQKNFLADAPTLWPLKGVRGTITSFHGPAEHPFTGIWYFHKGIDIAQATGTPIVATANGKVGKVDYDANGYGNYADLEHKYGFRTRFAHMSRVFVSKGQQVLRGQLIGAVGSTGYSTGPHVHYEVHMGTQLVDPMLYLNISSDLLDQTSGVDGRGFERSAE